MDSTEDGTPGTPGPLSGFAVYSSSDLEEETAQDTAGGPESAGEGASEDFGERYIEPEDIPVTHNVRMRPGSSLSIGRRNVYRTDRRGVPHFVPGWLPAHARAHYLRTCVAAAAVAGAAVAGSAVMALAGTGSNPEYTALAAEENLVRGEVVSVTRSTEPDPGNPVLFRTTEATTVTYEADGARTGHIETSTTDAVPPLAQETQLAKGDGLDLYVDPEDPDHFVVSDPGEPGKTNVLTFIPLLPAAAGTAAALIARKKMLLMRQLEEQS
ncbi:DUF3592 domain-containing protein [Arthrobacter caoxuetaonis]|uniref:Uncharacterized protein n=1 Tax=Arthrobacter caoxuetaonis TaxID=2886935 RepID=A0A9X1MJ31_9MICC|nr:DUF3592 domain-containing protein [Arthrobacter caoxuetaonis]MCC3299464.1 hypothetical protein [Arthrobacter caoxuetaonis]USQ59044.1 hypothetical protein NF551_18230 [Arthrobacter caoxuetaonis]